MNLLKFKGIFSFVAIQNTGTLEIDKAERFRDYRIFLQNFSTLSNLN